jgi:cytochrome c1
MHDMLLTGSRIGLLVVTVTSLLAGPAAPVAAQESRTVWDGVYTEAQATRGEQVYQDECTFCHLDDLMGDAFATPLIEDAFTFRWDGSTVGDLMTVIQVTMPADRPATLSDEAVADVIAFLLKMNEYPAGEQELAADQAALEAIAIVAAPAP